MIAAEAAGEDAPRAAIPARIRHSYGHGRKDRASGPVVNPTPAGDGERLGSRRTGA